MVIIQRENLRIPLYLYWVIKKFYFKTYFLQSLIAAICIARKQKFCSDKISSILAAPHAL